MRFSFVCFVFEIVIKQKNVLPGTRGAKKSHPTKKKVRKSFVNIKTCFIFVVFKGTKPIINLKITIMENNSLNLLRDAMRVDFENRVNLVRPNLDDLTTEWNNFVEYFTRSYLDEWRGEGGSDEDFNEFVEDLFNDIPNVLL